MGQDLRAGGQREVREGEETCAVCNCIVYPVYKCAFARTVQIMKLQRPMSFMRLDAETLNRVFVNRIQQYINIIIHQG